MLELHEVLCQFKYYNANDIHSKVVYTYNFFTIKCKVSYTQTYNATYMSKDSNSSLVYVPTQYSKHVGSL